MGNDHVISQLEKIKRVTNSGIEYWRARDIQPILGYSLWVNFAYVIEKAKMACENSGVDASHHFVGINNKILGGKGAALTRSDYALSRYACYLVAMNGEPSKTEIGIAQTYFAVQTRKQELSESGEEEKRLELRGRLKDSIKHLNDAAKNSGVQNFALFNDAGYIGLYGLHLSAIKAKKGIPKDHSLFDRAGRVELAANDFRATQTEQRLINEDVQGQGAASVVHGEVGRTVRKAMKEIGGKMPEDLPAEKPIRQLAKEVNRRKLTS